MKKFVFLVCLGLLCSSCANEPATTSPAAKQQPTPETSQSPHLENLTIGMPREAVEKQLGAPTSVTDTAIATTAVWIFPPNAAQAAPPQSNSGFIGALGGIATTIAGVFSPIAGVATSVGNQVYQASQAASQESAAEQANQNETLIVTIEFRENKVFSIQRAKPSNITPVPSR